MAQADTTLGQLEAPRPASRLTLYMLLSMGVCGAVFTLWPGLDLQLSAAFYREEIGFTGDTNAFVLALYRGIPMVSDAIILGLLIALFTYAFQRDEHDIRRRIQVGYLITALVLGPGLLIDVVLKDYWGRARPHKVMEFGGAATFTPALVPTNQCQSNCSFVSGHASAGFFAVSLGFLGGAAARRRWTLIGLVLGGVGGFGRLAQGGHFLSDIVFSFYATWFAACLAWVIFLKLGWMRDPDQASPSSST